MPIAGHYFVTPHAVRQFQKRVKALPYNQALAVILHGLETEPEKKLTRSGVPYVRIRHPYGFRAIIDERQTTAEKPLPAVVTILKG